MEVRKISDCTGNHTVDKKKIDPITLDPLKKTQFILKIGNVCYNNTTLLDLFLSKDTQMSPFFFHKTNPHVYANIADQLDFHKDPTTNIKLSETQIFGICNKLSEFTGRKITEDEKTRYISWVGFFNEENPELRNIYFNDPDDPDSSLGGSRKSKKRKGKPYKGKPYKKSRKSKRKR